MADPRRDRPGSLTFPVALACLLIVFLGWPDSTFAAARLEDLILTSAPDEDRLLVKLSDRIQPRVHKDVQEDCWLVDLVDVIGPKRVARKREYRGPLRLFWAETLSSAPPVQRLYLYVRPGTALKLVQRNGPSFELIVRGSDASAAAPRSPAPGRGRVAMPLIRPSPVEEEVALNVSEGSLPALLQDLEARLGILLFLLDSIPDKITIRAQAANPFEALHLLATHVGLVCDIQDGRAWLARPDNPLWQVSGVGLLSGKKFAGRPLEEVLPDLTGLQLARPWLARLAPEAREEPLPALPEEESPRFWVSRLLSAHGVTP